MVFTKFTLMPGVQYPAWFLSNMGRGGGVTRPFPRGGGVEELHRDPTVGPRPKVWNKDKKWKK